MDANNTSFSSHSKMSKRRGLRLKALPEATTFHSWSQSKSIYYPINYTWTLEDLSEQINTNRMFYHPTMTSKDMYSPDFEHTRFFLQLYPRGQSWETRNNMRLVLNYRGESAGPEKVKVYMTAYFVYKSTGFEIGLRRKGLRCALKPGDHKAIDSLIDNMDRNRTRLNNVNLNIDIKVFTGIESVTNLSLQPANAEEREQLEIRYRRELETDLLNFLDSEVNTQVNVKVILDNGFKFLLGALLPWAARAIGANFDDFFASYMNGIDSETLNVLFRFLFSGDRPRRISRVLETAARKLNIVSLVDAIQDALLRKRKSQVQDDYQAKRQKSTSNLTLAGQVKGKDLDPLEGVAGPSGLGSLSLEDVSTSGKAPKASRKRSSLQLSGKRPKVAKQSPTGSDASEHFTLSHIWAINNIFTDPAKEKLIESPRFYPPHNKHVQFSLRLRMPQNGNRYMSLTATAHLEGYKQIGVECFFSAKNRLRTTISGSYRTKKLLKNNGSICHPNFFERDMRYNLIHNETHDTDQDNIFIHCRIKVSLFQPRPIVEEELSATGFNQVMLVNKLEALLTSEQFAEFELRIGKELRAFRAHRTILFARSETLRELYNDDPVLGGRHFNFQEYPTLAPEVMPDILLHMYTGKLPPVERMSLQLCEAALVLKLNSLHHECVNALADTLSVDTITAMLKRADELKDKKLKHKCFDYRIEHFDWIEDCSEFTAFMIANSYLNIEYMIYLDENEDVYTGKD